MLSKIARFFLVAVGVGIVLFVVCSMAVAVMAEEKITDLHRQYWLALLAVSVLIYGAGATLYRMGDPPRRKKMYQGRQRLGVVVLLVSALATSACAGLGPHAQQGLLLGASGGALIGYGATGDGKVAALGAGLGALGGLTVGSVMDWFDGRERREAAMAAAVAAAQGATSCTRQERWDGGRVVTDLLDCKSATTRAGFRGDPMPPGAVLPAVKYEPGSVVIDPYK